jgi:hypothetical protein
MFQHIALLGAYVNAKQWNVSKMKNPYNMWLPTLIQIIYKRDKVYYFSNKNAISTMIAIKGKYVN